RHTRSDRDWSSDVCSSDLVDLSIGAANQKQFRSSGKKFARAAFVRLHVTMLVTDHALERFAQLRERQRVRRSAGENKINITVGRSEERRVGKECRKRMRMY